jgi:hypothetical protein
MQRLNWLSRLAIVTTIGGTFAVLAQQPEPVFNDSPPAADEDAPPDEAGPPVARISLLNGDVSVRRGDSGDSVAAALNAPMMADDIMATGQDARAEIQFDYANRFRLGHDGEVRIAEMDAGRYRLELAHGTASFSVLHESRAQAEISTPNVSVRPLGPGLYRVWVRDDGQTVVTIRRGQAEVYTERGTRRVSEGQTIFVRGTAQDPEYQIAAAGPRDEWDSWNEARDRSLEQVQSYRYMSKDIYGGEDLDRFGRWNYDPAYGQVWTPQVGTDWAPYSDGRWVWQDYYGWTWLSADPWGWAPYHYGSWYRHASFGWCWYPGPIYRPYFWRPALVAFFGWGGRGGGFGGWGNVGWVPLAPYEVYRPWYGRGWYGGYRRGVVNNINITNVNITNIYRNAGIRGGVMGVAANSFASGNFRGIARIQPDQIRQAGLVRGAVPIAPGNSHLRFSDRQTSVIPRALNNSRFIARTPINRPERVPFNQQRQAIERSAQQFAANGYRNVRTAPMQQGSAGRQFAQSPQVTRENPQNRGSGWSGFGSPNRAPQAQRSTEEQFRQNGSTNTRGSRDFGWSRFGTPNRSGTQQQYSQPQNRPNNASPYNARPSYGNGQQGSYPSAPRRAPNSSGGWERFNGRNNVTPRSSEPSRSNFQGGFGQPRSQSLQLSPPIVRQRSNDGWQPRSAPSYGSSSAYRAPTYSAPRNYSTPRNYSAPSYGGGGFSRPSYEAPRSYGGGGRSYSAPSYGGGGRSTPSYSGGGRSYSAPSYSGGGRSSGGGGGHSSGGGHSDGGRRGR